MNFGIIEIGSTNTKAYLYEHGNLVDLGSQFIPFKTNYQVQHCLSHEDIDTLLNFVKGVKEKVSKVYAFGTSIFRKISDKELTDFKMLLKDNFDISFEVVSSDEENEYTVNGVLANNDYNGRMVVVIGGGGSTG